jgi:hypothetical protein
VGCIAGIAFVFVEKGCSKSPIFRDEATSIAIILNFEEHPHQLIQGSIRRSNCMRVVVVFNREISKVSRQNRKETI